MGPPVDPVDATAQLPSWADVVIVGGGIIGASAALFLAEKGVSTVLVEGGAGVAKSFLDEGLVDRLIVFRSPLEIDAADGVAVAGLDTHIADEFTILRQTQFGGDACMEYVRKA